MMRNFIRSDLFRSLMGGFLIGAAAVVALTPADGSHAIKARIEALYKA